MNRYVVEEQGGEFVLPLAGFVCSGWEGYGWLVVRRNESGDEARIGLDPEKHRDLATELVAAEEVEAWEVRGPGDVLVVAPIGEGEPAIWDATSKTFTIKGGQVPPELDKILDKMLEGWIHNREETDE